MFRDVTANRLIVLYLLFCFNDTATTEIYTLSYTTLFRSPTTLLPHSLQRRFLLPVFATSGPLCWGLPASRSEEHTSELQSPVHLVCRLLLEKKKFGKGTVSKWARLKSLTLMPFRETLLLL